MESLDELMRRYVLVRDGFKCLRCGARPIARSWSQRSTVLQAAHVYGKGAYPALRYVPENLITLCRDRCHIGWWHRQGFGREAGENSVRAWCLEALGEKRMEQLDLMARSWKGGKLDLKAERLRLEQLVAELGLVL